MLFQDKTYEISPLKIMRYVLKHMVVLFWGVSIAPFYMAWVFASRLMYPITGGAILINFIIGIIIIGPFLGSFTLLFNDYWDYKMDKTSRRKANYPLPKGLIPRMTILKVSIGCMTIAILLSFIISLLFTLLILLCILLAIIYSASPLRIKNQPGLDILLNGFGAGILCSLAGWVLLKPINEFPNFWMVPMFFGVAAIYIPTTIIDYDSDKTNKVNTIAVRLGKKGAFYLGLGCITIANIGIIFMGLTNYLISIEFIYLVWPISIFEVVGYWVILRNQTFKNVLKTIVWISIFLILGNLLILLHVTGNFFS